VGTAEGQVVRRVSGGWGWGGCGCDQLGVLCATWVHCGFQQLLPLWVGAQFMFGSYFVGLVRVWFLVAGFVCTAGVQCDFCGVPRYSSLSCSKM
jgi:hypothetical protein